MGNIRLPAGALDDIRIYLTLAKTIENISNDDAQLFEKLGIRESMERLAVDAMALREEIIAGVTTEQADRLMRDIRSMRVRVETWMPQAVKNEGYRLERTHDLMALIVSATEDKCAFCGKSRAEAHECRLRHALRSILFTDAEEKDGCEFRYWDYTIEQNPEESDEVRYGL